MGEKLSAKLLTAGVLLMCVSACSSLFADTRTATPTALPSPMPSPAPTLPPTPTPFIAPTALATVSSETSCLRFNNLSVDLRTASAKPYLPPTLSPSPTPDMQTEPLRQPSPDGRYALLHTGSAVYLETLEGERVLIEQNPAPQYEFDNRVRWAPDSSRFLYAAGSYERGDHLLLFTADGSQRHDVTPLDNIYGLMEWSADSQYYMLATNNSFQVWQMGDPPHLTEIGLPLASNIGLQWQFWAPQGHRLVYMWLDGRNGQNDYYITIASPGEQGAQFAMEDAAPHSYTLFWSPDSQWLAAIRLAYNTNGTRFQYEIDLYGADGTLKRDALVFETMANAPIPITPLWSPQSDRFAIIIQHSLDRYDLVTYEIATGITGTVIAGASRMPAFMLEGQHPHEGYMSSIPHNVIAGGRFALYFVWTDGKGIDVINVDGSNRLTFISGAQDLGDPTWSLNAEYLTAVWSTGTGSSREIHLAWMRADGTGRFDVQDDFWSVHDLRWLDQAQTGEPLLAYTVWRREGFGVEVINLQTGEARVIVEGLQDVTDLQYNRQLNELYFMWKLDGYTGMARFTPEGELLEWRPSQQEYRNGEEWHWSPDFSTVAVRTYNWNNSGEGLYLRNNTGTVRTYIVRGVYRLGVPVWSPDGALLAFTQPDAFGTTTVRVIDRRGYDVWRTDGIYQVDYLAWGDCA